MLSSTLLSLISSLALLTGVIAAPSQIDIRQDDCECAVCEINADACSGEDQDALFSCQSVTLSQCGRSCLDLAPGTGAQDGCLAAQITIQQPCENACVQAALNDRYCSTLDPNDEFYDKFCG